MDDLETPFGADFEHLAGVDLTLWLRLVLLVLTAATAVSVAAGSLL